MGQNTNDRIQVNAQLYPAYYPEFHCIANQCQNNCCHNWRIQFSKKDYLKIKRAPKSSEVEELTKRAMHRLPDGQRTEQAYGEFRATDGPCPYQNEQGLCRLQLGCGEETLPYVCRQFPRIDTYTPMALERGLSTACEAVVEQLWNLPQGIDFVMDPLPRQQWRSYPVTDRNLRFAPMRETTLDILQDRRMPLTQRLLVLGMALDNARTTWETMDLAAWQARTELLRNTPELTAPLMDIPRDVLKGIAFNMRIALGMERLEDVRPMMEQLNIAVQSREGENYTGSIQTAPYLEAEAAMMEQLGDLEYFFENLLVNAAFWHCIPDTKSADDLWKSYISLCTLYGFFRFMAVISCGMEPSKEKLFQGIVLASRAMLHSSDRRSMLQQQLYDNDSATLAHMAVLVKG